VLNTHFWCDPQSDVAAVLMTQFLPFMDNRFMNAYENFERTAYSVMPTAGTGSSSTA
jgi:hypothetical protein